MPLKLVESYWISTTLPYLRDRFKRSVVNSLCGIKYSPGIYLTNFNIRQIQLQYNFVFWNIKRTRQELFAIQIISEKSEDDKMSVRCKKKTKSSDRLWQLQSTF